MSLSHNVFTLLFGVWRHLERYGSGHGPLGPAAYVALLGKGEASAVLQKQSTGGTTENATTGQRQRHTGGITTRHHRMARGASQCHASESNDATPLET